MSDTKSLNQRMKDFINSLAHAEDLDAPNFGAAFGSQPRADFLLFDRKIVTELKAIETDPEFKAGEVLRQMIPESELPKLVGLSGDSETILSKLDPALADQIRERLFFVVTRQVATAYARSQKQIEDTKSKLGLSAFGMTIFVNEGVEILDPEMIIERIARTMNQDRETGVGGGAEVVLIVSEGHTLSAKGMIAHPPIIQMYRDSTDRSELTELVARLAKDWAAHNKISYIDRGNLETFQGIEIANRSGRRVLREGS